MISDSVDTSDYIWLPSSWLDPLAYFDLDSSFIPLIGLGLSIAGQESPDEDQFVAAIHAVTVPASVDLGLRYPDLSWGGNLNTLSSMFEAWQDGKYGLHGTPRPDCAPLNVLTNFMQLVPLLPIVNLPGTWEYWVVAEHLVLLLWRLALGDIDLRTLPPLKKWSRPEKRALPYRQPAVGGNVTIGQVRTFGARFPHLAKVLKAEIPWTGSRAHRSAPADIANALASQLLGIEVDLRVGFLVSPTQIQQAIVLATRGVDGPDHEKLVERVERLVKRRLRTVAAPGGARRVDGIQGAAWSCAVDAVLSARDAHVGAR